MAVDQLQNLALNSAKEEFGFRFGSHGDEKSKASRRRLLRRQVARIQTVLAEKERGTAATK
jgi:ribosomal protein L29